MNKLTAYQIDLRKHNATHEARRIFDSIETRINKKEINEEFKCEAIRVLTEIITDNAECRGFIHEILRSGLCEGCEGEAQRILNKTIDI